LPFCQCALPIERSKSHVTQPNCGKIGRGRNTLARSIRY
jgi:hypothetical protein